MSTALRAADLDSASEELWKLLMAGESDYDAQFALGIDAPTYLKVKVHMLDMKAQALRSLPTEHVYVQYVLDQGQNIRELTAMMGQFKKTKQYNAMVGALRLRADLHDRILSKGQECGIIHREAQRKEVIAGIVITDLTNLQLRGQLQTELNDINDMMNGHGEVKFLDVEAGPTHHGPTLKKPKSAKKALKKKAPKSTKKRAKKKQRVVDG